MLLTSFVILKNGGKGLGDDLLNYFNFIPPRPRKSDLGIFLMKISHVHGRGKGGEGGGENL